MRQMTWLWLAILMLAISACGSPEQPAGKPGTPAVASPAPPAVPPAQPVPPPPTTPLETAKPAPAAAPAAMSTPTPSAAPTAAAKPDLKKLIVRDTITLAASQGLVTLSHLSHAQEFPCATCHGENTPGKFELTKETAHALCRDCHQAKSAGPVSCAGCHKK